MTLPGAEVRSVPNRTRQRKAGRVQPREVCFILMPFGGWLDDYYEAIYTPAIEAAGLEPHRADDLFRPSTIVNDIWAYTKRAKLLLADLSGRNPNVFYELGLAHALAKPVILVAESMEEIPFDLRALRIIIYDKNAPNWGQLLRDKVTAAITEVLRAPVEAVLPAFLNVRADASKPTVSPHEKEVIEIKQELDLLRREIRGRQVEEVLPRRDLLDPEEARDRIRSYLKMGMPPALVIERLERLGPPRSWIIHEMERFKATRRSRAPTRKQKSKTLSAARRDEKVT